MQVNGEDERGAVSGFRYLESEVAIRVVSQVRSIFLFYIFTFFFG